MKTKSYIHFILAIGFIILSNVSSAYITEQTYQAASSMGAHQLGEIEFVSGTDNLTDAAKADLKNIIDELQPKDELDHIKILVWSDHEYPANKKTETKADIELAKKRISSLKKYLKNELRIRSVKGYNMAERPNKLKEFFNTSDAKVKKVTEISGAAPVNEDDTGLFGEKSQASKAIVMLFLKKKTKVDQ